MIDSTEPAQLDAVVGNGTTTASKHNASVSIVGDTTASVGAAAMAVDNVDAAPEPEAVS